jgi:hypothetical protein
MRKGKLNILIVIVQDSLQSTVYILSFIYLFLVVPRCELRVSHVLGRHSTT